MNGVKISGSRKINQPEVEDNYSIAFDFSEMHEAGNHEGIDYSCMPVEITKPDGTYITTLRTDLFGITNRLYTREKEEIIAWAGSRTGLWEIIEEYEVPDEEDAPEDNNA